MHLGANMRTSWQDTSPNMVGRCYFITLALTTQKTFGAIVADVELIVTDDDTMHIEGTARCAADGSTIVSDGLNLAIRDSNLLHNLSTETLRYSSFTRGLHL